MSQAPEQGPAADRLARLAAAYQRLAEREPWHWDGEHASLLYSLTYCLGDYQTEILCPKGAGANPELTVRIRDGGKVVYAFQGHRGTVFTRVGATLYLAEFHPSTTGCAVAAYDFKAKKLLWKTRLRSISRLPHSAYHNAVTIENNGEALIVRGNEELLRYVEYLDMRTGKTLAQREYPRT